MAHYFTREEAEALLPQITIVLRNIQQSRKALQEDEEALNELRLQAMGNGHHLHERIITLQKSSWYTREDAREIVGRNTYLRLRAERPEK